MDQLCTVHNSKCHTGYKFTTIEKSNKNIFKGRKMKVVQDTLCYSSSQLLLQSRDKERYCRKLERCNLSMCDKRQERETKRLHNEVVYEFAV